MFTTALRDADAVVQTNNDIASRETYVFLGECHVFVMHYTTMRCCAPGLRPLEDLRRAAARRLLGG